jgi:hypothetical protein
MDPDEVSSLMQLPASDGEVVKMLDLRASLLAALKDKNIPSTSEHSDDPELHAILEHPSTNTCETFLRFLR